MTKIKQELQVDYLNKGATDDAERKRDSTETKE